MDNTQILLIAIIAYISGVLGTRLYDAVKNHFGEKKLMKDMNKIVELMKEVDISSPYKGMSDMEIAKQDDRERKFNKKK